MIDVTRETFEQEVKQASKPVLVDFWGPRCGPCLALMPLVEELSTRFSEQLKVVKVNAQENRRLCVELKVLSLPTFLFFNRGQEQARLSGDIHADALQPWVEAQLGNLME